MSEKNIVKKVVSGFAWEGSVKVIVQALSWISTVYVARILNPEDYGIVAISGIFTGFCMLIGGMGLSAGIIQRREITRQQKDGIFWLSLLLNFSMFAFLFAIAPLVAEFYKIDILTDIIRLAGGVLIISSLSMVPHAEKVRDLNFRFTALTGMFASFIVTLTVFSMAFYGYGVWSLVISVLAGEFFIALVYTSQFNHFPKLGLNLADVMPVVRYGAGIMGSRILHFFNATIGVFISGIFLGYKSTGYYQFADTLARLPMKKIGRIFNDISFASLSSIQDDKESSRRLLFSFHKYLVYVSYPVLVGIVLVSNEIVLVLLTEKWLPMLPVLRLVCITAMMSITVQILPRFLESQGQVRKVFRFQLVSLVVTAFAMFVGAQYGLVQMLMAALLVYPFLYIYLLNLILPLMGATIREFFGSFYVVILINIAMALALTVARFYLDGLSPLSMLVMLVAIGVLVYIVLSLIFMKDDVSSLKSIISGSSVSADQS